MTEPPVDLSLLVRSALALAAVLALLLAGRWVLVRRGIASTAPLRPVDGLRIAGTLSLDARHRLVVIRRGEAELLLAIGPKGVSQIAIEPPAAIASATTRVP